MKVHTLRILTIALLSIFGPSLYCQAQSKPIVCAYTVDENVAFEHITHAIFSFAHIDRKTHTHLNIPKANKLKALIKQRNEKAPNVKIMLAIGGWGSGGFSTVAASAELRTAFAKNCAKTVEIYQLDGLDIDWEYPTIASEGIDASPQDTANFNLFIRDLRKALGADKLLTVAAPASGAFFDWPTALPFIDWVNIMTYDMGYPPKHHGSLTVGIKNLEQCIKRGIPANKIVFGIPFYARCVKPLPQAISYKNLHQYEGKGYTRRWDDKEKSPYLVDKAGKMVASFDDPHSIKVKAQMIKQRKLLGAMYWCSFHDTSDHLLAKTLFDALQH